MADLLEVASTIIKCFVSASLTAIGEEDRPVIHSQVNCSGSGLGVCSAHIAFHIWESGKQARLLLTQGEPSSSMWAGPSGREADREVEERNSYVLPSLHS